MRISNFLRRTTFTLFIASLVAAAPVATAPTTQPFKLPKGVKALHDLPYVKNPSPNQHLDLYLPEKAPSSALPVIVFFHGGAWHKGTKERPSAAVKFVPRGYAVASVEYRFTQDAPFPAQIDDCRSAIRYLRAHADEYHLDKSHFGVWGTSAGGHLVSLLGTAQDQKKPGDENAGQSSAVQAVCDCYGPADLRVPGMIPPSVRALLGGTIEEKANLAAEASPITHISKDAAPFLILHGDADPVVPIDQSKRFAAALKEAGAEVTFTIVPGAGHGGAQFNTSEIRKEIEDFFDKHLKNKRE